MYALYESAACGDAFPDLAADLASGEDGCCEGFCGEGLGKGGLGFEGGAGVTC